VEKAFRAFAETNRYLQFAGASESHGERAPVASESEADDIDWESAEIIETAEPVAKEPKRGVTIYQGGPLDFNLSSSGISLTGKTNSASDLRAFIERLKVLAAVLPDGPKEGSDDEDE